MAWSGDDDEKVHLDLFLESKRWRKLGINPIMGCAEGADAPPSRSCLVIRLCSHDPGGGGPSALDWNPWNRGNCSPPPIRSSTSSSPTTTLASLTTATRTPIGSRSTTPARR